MNGKGRGGGKRGKKRRGGEKEREEKESSAKSFPDQTAKAKGKELDLTAL